MNFKMLENLPRFYDWDEQADTNRISLGDPVNTGIEVGYSGPVRT